MPFQALSPAVHATIEEAVESELFSTCMTTLETLNVKAQSDVLARDELYKRPQNIGENVDTLWHEIQALSRKCNFLRQPTAEENLADNVRVAFTLALRSPEIRYGILQGKGETKAPLTGVEALELARSLEQAKAE